jgi:hypothetical protein
MIRNCSAEPVAVWLVEISVRRLQCALMKMSDE